MYGKFYLGFVLHNEIVRPKLGYVWINTGQKLTKKRLKKKPQKKPKQKLLSVKREVFQLMTTSIVYNTWCWSTTDLQKVNVKQVKIPSQNIPNTSFYLFWTKIGGSSWGHISREIGSCIDPYYDHIHYIVNHLLQSPFFIRINEKLAAKNNENSKNLLKYIKNATEGLSEDSQGIMLRNMYRVLETTEVKKLIHVKGLVDQVKDYIYKTIAYETTDMEEE